MNVLSLSPQKVIKSRNKMNFLLDLLLAKRIEDVVLKANKGDYQLYVKDIDDVIDLYFSKRRFVVEQEDIAKFRLFLQREYTDLPKSFIETLMLFFSKGFMDEEAIIDLLDKIKAVDISGGFSLLYDDIFSLIYFDELKLGD